MRGDQRNDGVISKRLLNALIVAWVAAFVSVPVAVMWLPEGAATVAAAFALTLFVAAQAAELIGSADDLYSLFRKEGRRERRALKGYRNN
jgi:hypothetical protein